MVSPVVQGGSPQPRLDIRGKLIAKKNLASGRTGTVSVHCPRNYVPISGNLYLGVVLPVFDGPSNNGRGWAAGGLNPGRRRHSFRVGVVCVKGARNLSVTASSNKRAADEAMQEAREALESGELDR